VLTEYEVAVPTHGVAVADVRVITVHAPEAPNAD
jgi:hypothetical protein